MIKKIILWSCLVSGVLSVGSIATILVLIPLKNNSVSNDKNLRIEPFPGIINISQEELNTMTSNIDPLNSRVAALSKLFNGVNEKNINNFIVEQISDETIILIANQDYYFHSEGIKTLSANFKVV
ncbi:MAG: hypothetical protein ACRDA7_03380 [Metamycoplasmataceae bacterium]